MTRKRTKLFYKAVAAIRLKKAEHLLPTMLKRKFKTGYGRAARLWNELVTHGVVEELFLPSKPCTQNTAGKRREDPCAKGNHPRDDRQTTNGQESISPL